MANNSSDDSPIDWLYSVRHGPAWPPLLAAVGFAVWADVTHVIDLGVLAAVFFGTVYVRLQQRQEVEARLERRRELDELREEVANLKAKLEHRTGEAP